MKSIQSIKLVGVSLLIGVALAGSVTFAAWQGTAWITNGTTITASKIKENFDFLRSRVWAANATGLYNTKPVGVGTGPSTWAQLSVRKDGNGPALYGYTTGAYYAVIGRSSSVAHGGVLGYSADASAYGILGHANSYALYGKGQSYITGNSRAAAFVYNSDRRLKEDIQPITNPQDVLKLRPKDFVWKSGDRAGQQDFGFIAQEVEQVYPELVFTDPSTGYKGVDYVRIIVPLLEMVKQQQSQIDVLEARLNAL